MVSGETALVLETRGLCFGWPGIPLFQDLNLQIPPGVSMVSGEESSGKTTLLRLLCADIQPHSGSIRLCNPLDRLALPLGAHAFRTEPRTEQLDPTSAEAWWESLAARFPSFDGRLAHELADGFALGPHIGKPMYMLSAGSKRKVWLCAAFAAGTSLTLIDEPFAALDMASIRFLRELLVEASQHATRAWVLADHAAPEGIALKTTLVLPG